MSMGEKSIALFTIISSDAFLEGTLSSEGGVRIDGRFRGRIECEGTIVISKSGKVEGEIVADDIVVAGELSGNVTAKEGLHLSQSGKLYGDIFVGTLVMEQGVIFEGNCRMLSRQELESMGHSPALIAQSAST